MSHIGFTPQFNKRFKVLGNTNSEQTKLLRLAKEIEKSGAFYCFRMYELKRCKKNN